MIHICKKISRHAILGGGRGNCSHALSCHYVNSFDRLMTVFAAQTQGLESTLMSDTTTCFRSQTVRCQDRRVNA